MENIQYWNAVDVAWSRMKTILFQPFDIEKWFVMGFAAWIAGLNSGGGGGGGGGGVQRNYSSGGGGEEFSQFWHEYGGIIIAIAIVAFIVIMALSIAFAWLHARGRFIFLDNVLRNRAAIAEPWKKYRTQGNSLFLWNLALGFIGLFIFLLGAVVCAPMIVPMFRSGEMAGLGIFGIVLASFLFLVFAVVMGFIEMLVNDFVVPIMLRHDLRIREAWSRFGVILGSAFGSFVLYALMRMLIGLVVGTVIMLACFLTCCCLLIALAIPYLGTVLLLPVLVFTRLIGIEFLRQFGENIGEIEPPPLTGIPALP